MCSPSKLSPTQPSNCTGPHVPRLLPPCPFAVPEPELPEPPEPMTIPEPPVPPLLASSSPRSLEQALSASTASSVVAFMAGMGVYEPNGALDWTDGEGGSGF